MTKKDIVDKRYIYNLLCFIKMIKLSIESKNKHIATAKEISIEVLPLRLIMLLILTEITTEFNPLFYHVVTCV